VKFLKIKLLVISLVMFAASSAFASLSYDVTVDTTSLVNSGYTTGYLYFQYNTAINQVGTSTAAVQNFSTDGVLGSTAAGAYGNSGNYVVGTLPGTVSFTNGNVEVNDYNHGITFGNNFHFSLLLPTGTSQIAGSTFSLGLFQDALGYTPLKTVDGTLFTINLNADGTATTVVADAGTNVTPTPIPAAFWLLGSGLAGLVGIRRRS
jgi:hypothetical protein